MRTTPLAKWEKQAKKFDQQIWDAAQSILGLTFSDQSWKQACLTPRLGGLGLRKIVDHADIAFSASWWESKATCREEWSVRPEVKGTKAGLFQEGCERGRAPFCLFGLSKRLSGTNVPSIVVVDDRWWLMIKFISHRCGGED